MTNKSSPISDGKVVALNLLLQACEDADEAGQDVWEFALDAKAFFAAGVTESDLRWLLSHRYAHQGVEVRERGAIRRTFRKVSSLSTPREACFVLSHAGRIFMSEHRLPRRPFAKATLSSSSVNGESERRIVWLRHCRQLIVDGVVAKSYKRVAPAQWIILDAFEAIKWAATYLANPRSLFPVPPSPQRVREIVADLNMNLDATVHFHCSASADSVWYTMRVPVTTAPETSVVSRAYRSRNEGSTVELSTPD